MADRNNRGRKNHASHGTGRHKDLLPDLAPVDYFDKPEKPKKVITLPTLKFMGEKNDH